MIQAAERVAVIGPREPKSRRIPLDARNYTRIAQGKNKRCGGQGVKSEPGGVMGKKHLLFGHLGRFQSRGHSGEKASKREKLANGNSEAV